MAQVEVVRVLLTHTLAYVHASVRSGGRRAPEVYFSFLAAPLPLLLDPSLPFDAATRASAFRCVQAYAPSPPLIGPRNSRGV